MQVGAYEITEQWRGDGSPTVWQWGDSATSVATVLDVAKVQVAGGFADGSTGYVRPSDVSKLLLGYARYDPNTRKISRTLPVNIALADWLYAEKITNMHGLGKALVPLAFVPIQSGGYTTLKLAMFQRWRCTVLFTGRNYDVLSDAEAALVGGEWCRFVEKEYHPGIEIVQRRQGQFYFANGPQANDPFPMGITRRSPKATVKWTWRQVPARAVLLPNGVLSPKITACLGCVNHAAFPPGSAPNDPGFTGFAAPQLLAQALGQFAAQVLNTANRPPPDSYGPYTLLLTQVGVKPYLAPTSPGDLGILGTNSVPRYVDLEFYFSHFDPAMEPGVDYGGYAGHLLVPAAGDGTTAASQASYYYLATAVKNPDAATRMAGRKLYEPIDFANLFATL